MKQKYDWLVRLLVAFWLAFGQSAHSDQTIFQPTTYATPGASLIIQSGVPVTAPMLEPALGNPGTSGFVLSSTTGGTRSWIAPSAGGAPSTATYITQTTDAGLSGEQALSALATGLMKVTTTTGVVTSITDNSTNWNTAYTERAQWDGGATNLVAGTGRTSLGGSTVGQNVFTLTNPSAITFPRFNADNSVTAMTALVARGSGGINTESRTTFTNANYAALATDHYIASTSTVFTAIRTLTLPAANAVNAGSMLYVGDDGAAITTAFYLIVARNGTDTIHGMNANLSLFTTRASVIIESDGVSNWLVVSRSPAVRVQVITSGTTFTPTVGAKSIWVECIGGGGGGGGALGAASSCGLGGGGCGGGYAGTYISNVKTSGPYTIGIGGGGAGGVGAASGTNGGNTTFDSPAVCTGSGGAGGTNLATGTTIAFALGSTQAAAQVGDITLGSFTGSVGIRFSGTAGVSGAGGAAPKGGGMTQSRSGQNDGPSGNLFGGGGGGALSLNTTSQTGGVGAAGCIIVTEFF